MSASEANGGNPLVRYAELLLRKGMLEEATVQLEELVGQEPSDARAHYLLAATRLALDDPAQAARHFQAVLELEPGAAKSLNGLGVALEQLGRSEEALACYQAALDGDPGYQDARINLALLLKKHGCLCEAERQLREALKSQPDAVRLRYNLANLLQLQGRSLEAVAAYRDTLRLDPDHLESQQNLLFALHYSERFTPAQIFAEHLTIAAHRNFQPVAADQPGLGGQAAAEPVPGRRIRVGYLSPDFRGHSVASFIEPILAHHDRDRFEITCYSNLERPDRTTERLKGLTEQWRELFQVGDEEAAHLIAQDGLDVLVDLAGHTSGNRLSLLARKPAPLQVTWIGYPDTTGMAQMDYRVTDRHADPPGISDELHSERLVRLPRSFCCYHPPETSPEVSPLPALGTGRVTFASFNNLAKVTPEVIELWARLLAALPQSGLLLKCPPLGDAELRERIRSQFRDRGIAGERLELHPGNPGIKEHLAQYQRVDIALDTFPYNGTTTSCEALWMGVPVVTLAGNRHAGRTGVSILSNLGLEELIARDQEQYLEVAAGLARNLGRLAQLRAGMRQHMRRSPLLDGAGVTREWEEALEEMLAG